MRSRTADEANKGQQNTTFKDGSPTLYYNLGNVQDQSRLQDKFCRERFWILDFEFGRIVFYDLMVEQSSSRPMECVSNPRVTHSMLCTTRERTVPPPFSTIKV
jgi:hypothetical protein